MTILISALVSVAVAGLVVWWFVRYERRLTIKTEHVVLTDSKGQARAMLGVVGGLPTLCFLDKRGNRRVGLAAQDDGSVTMSFMDAHEKTTGIMRMMAEGPSFAIEDDRGTARAELTVGVDGAPGLVLNDQDGKPRIVLAVPEGYPSLTFHDKVGDDVLFVYGT